MCNDYEQHVRWAEYCKMMQDLALDIPTQQTELDLPQADDIKINDRGPVMRAAGNVIELASMNFSVRHRAAAGRSSISGRKGEASQAAIAASSPPAPSSSSSARNIRRRNTASR